MWNIFEHVLRNFIIRNNNKLLITIQRVDVYLMNQSKLITNQISQSIKLVSQRHNRDKSGKDSNNSYFWKQKNKLVIRSIAIQEEAKSFMFWSKNTLFLWILQNILENQRFQQSLVWSIPTKWPSWKALLYYSFFIINNPFLILAPKIV